MNRKNPCVKCHFSSNFFIICMQLKYFGCIHLFQNKFRKLNYSHFFRTHKFQDSIIPLFGCLIEINLFRRNTFFQLRTNLLHFSIDRKTPTRPSF